MFLFQGKILSTVSSIDEIIGIDIAMIITLPPKSTFEPIAFSPTSLHIPHCKFRQNGNSCDFD